MSDLFDKAMRRFNKNTSSRTQDCTSINSISYTFRMGHGQWPIAFIPSSPWTWRLLRGSWGKACRNAKRWDSSFTSSKPTCLVWGPRLTLGPGICKQNLSTRWSNDQRAFQELISARRGEGPRRKSKVCRPSNGLRRTLELFALLSWYRTVWHGFGELHSTEIDTNDGNSPALHGRFRAQDANCSHLEYHGGYKQRLCLDIC